MQQLHKPFHFSMSDLTRIITEELRRGKTQDDMIAYLQARGWPHITAEQFVKKTAFAEAVADQGAAEQQAQTMGMQMGQESWRAAIWWMIALTGLAFVIVDVISRGMPF